MGGSRVRVGRLGWKAWLGGLAVVGLTAAGMPAGAAAPTVPGAPKIVSVHARVRSVKVVFTPPTSNGGAKITSYKATCKSTSGGLTGSRSALTSPIVVPSLKAGTKYKCTVVARNRVGLGPASTPSGTVVPLA